MFESYYNLQAKRLRDLMQAAPWGSDERKKLLHEFLNYSRQSLTSEKLETAVRRLQSADNEKLARMLFDNRAYGITLKSLSRNLGVPTSKVKSGLRSLRGNGFQWYADKEKDYVHRYYLTELHV